MYAYFCLSLIVRNKEPHLLLSNQLGRPRPQENHSSLQPECGELCESVSFSLFSYQVCPCAPSPTYSGTFSSVFSYLETHFPVSSANNTPVCSLAWSLSTSHFFKSLYPLVQIDFSSPGYLLYQFYLCHLWSCFFLLFFVSARSSPLRVCEIGIETSIDVHQEGFSWGQPSAIVLG